MPATTSTETAFSPVTLTFKTATDAPANVMQAVNIIRQLRLDAYRAERECEIRIGQSLGTGKYACEVTALTLDLLDSETVLRCDCGTISL